MNFQIKLLILAGAFLPCTLAAQQCGNFICEPNETNCIRDCFLDTITLLLKDGGRVDISPDGKTIAYDKSGTDGYFDVYTMKANGTNQQCLTCNKIAVPQKHNGQPAWHTSGKWMVIQAEKQEHEGSSRYSTPGRGVFCDLWLMDDKGEKFYNLTNYPTDKGKGALHPHFSADGKKLSWSELYKPASFKHKGTTFGCFKLMVADFTFDQNGVPVLTNMQEFIPNDSVFYENHGFSPDGKELLFTSNFYLNQSPLGGNKLYKMELATKKATCLASEGYNEHGTYSPGGKYIVWGTNMGNKNKGMDYWVMNADGSNRQRLTYFNSKGSAEYEKTRLLAVDMSWSANGKFIVAYVQDGVLKDEGRICRIDFKEPLKE
jgi:Tol biopolymer transport system component